MKKMLLMIHPISCQQRQHLGDHPFTVAILVRLYVPYATKPKTKALNKKL